MQTCSNAASNAARGPKQMDFPVHCPNLYPPLDCESIHGADQAQEGVRTLTWPRVWGQPEHRGSAGGRGFRCPLTLGVKEQKKRSERWPRRAWAKPWKFKQIQGGEKITLVVLHTSQLMFCFLTCIILRIRGEPETVLFTASVGRNELCWFCSETPLVTTTIIIMNRFLNKAFYY